LDRGLLELREAVRPAKLPEPPRVNILNSEAAERGDVVGDDLENARAELLMRTEEARGILQAFRQRHGIPEPPVLGA
jgi:hypothetical protein